MEEKVSRGGAKHHKLNRNAVWCREIWKKNKHFESTSLGTVMYAEFFGKNSRIFILIDDKIVYYYFFGEKNVNCLFTNVTNP